MLQMLSLGLERESGMNLIYLHFPAFISLSWSEESDER